MRILNTSIMRQENNVCKFSLTFLLCGLMLLSSPGWSKKLKPRPMHRFHELGLQFEVYSSPTWKHSVVKSGKYPAILIDSPEKHFPPAQFIITPFPDIKVGEGQIRDVALSAMKSAKQTYGRKPQIAEEQFKPRIRGPFSGFETTFDARVQGADLSVQYFVGYHQKDGRMVSMTAMTQRDRLPHIKEHIRRTFDWVDYLEPAK